MRGRDRDNRELNSEIIKGRGKGGGESEEREEKEIEGGMGRI